MEILDEEVTNWEQFVTCTVNTGQAESKAFLAGRLRHHVSFWNTITFDPYILNIVRGVQIELESNPEQSAWPLPYKFSSSDMEQIDTEIVSMYQKGVIEDVDNCEDVFVSNIFTRKKSDGKLRIILDLSAFNEHVRYKHFKMDSIQTALDLMSPSCYMASIDWKDAYYSVPVAEEFRKYLVFMWKNQLLQYTCLPNGLASGPRLFTRLSKVLFSQLRMEGFISTSYIDDCLLFGKTLDEAKANVVKTVELSTKAGFVIHPEKSVLTPTREITYLGFILNSQSMTVRLTKERVHKIKTRCIKVLRAGSVTVHKFSHVIGLMVASFPGVKFGQLYYRRCDNFKTKSLKEGRGDFRTHITLTVGCRQDLEWWISNIEGAYRPVNPPPPKITLETDASNIGWGACVKGDESRQTGGKWSREEGKEHINYLEMLAVWLGIQCFVRDKQNVCIKILSDNTTTVAYLNHMGGTKPKCNMLARRIWTWCETNNNWIVAAHIPGEQNVIADKHSRTTRDNMEWQLCPDTFQKICTLFGTPDIDLFASRLNHQLPRYMAWKPDPGAEAVDAFLESWGRLFAYIFPPFNLVGRVLKKIEDENVKAIVIVPYWPTQSWFPKFLNLCSDPPFVLSSRGRPLLSHPRRDQKELPNTKLLVALTCVKPLGRKTCHQQHSKSSWPPGKAPQGNNTSLISDSGLKCVWKGRSTQLLQV